MRHISNKSTIMVTDALLHFEDVYQKPYFASQYLDEIKNANLLLIPSENIRENMEPIFPELTSDLFRYLKNHAQENVKVDIAVDDEHYHKLILHASPVALATILIREDILKETADLIVGFLNETAAKNHRETSEMDCFVNIIVDKAGEYFCKKIMFSGRVSELENALNISITKTFAEDAR